MFELIATPHTPFTASGELYLEPVQQQARHLRGSGVSGVFVAGSTGEGPSLTCAERRRLAERWVSVGEGLRVIVQVGHASLSESRELARHAAELGATAIGAAAPSWFPITSTVTLAATCSTIAEAAPELPFYYDHIPARSGVHVPMAPFLELRERVPSLAGIKYSHIDPLDFQACVREHGDDVQMLWGCDELLVTGLALGARGAVGGSYNFAAPLATRLIAAHAAGDTKAARREQARLSLLVETLSRHGQVTAGKTVMRLLGIDCGSVRLPLEPLPLDAAAALEADLAAIDFFDWIRKQPPRV